MMFMNALIVSKTESGIKAITSLLRDEDYREITCTVSVSDAKDKLETDSFDLIIINTPLSEESGVEFSLYCAGCTKSCVLMIVSVEKSLEVFNTVGSSGVLVISKPVNRHLFHHYLIFTQSFRKRMLTFEEENRKLRSELEEMKLVNRAKLLLMQCLSMTEQQAHRYIEKQAMNLRTSRIEIAKQVIRTYKN